MPLLIGVLPIVFARRHRTHESDCQLCQGAHLPCAPRNRPRGCGDGVPPLAKRRALHWAVCSPQLRRRCQGMFPVHTWSPGMNVLTAWHACRSHACLVLVSVLSLSFATAASDTAASFSRKLTSRNMISSHSRPRPISPLYNEGTCTP
jgi:hypothetical protein